jgi:hypothetical protein
MSSFLLALTPTAVTQRLRRTAVGNSVNAKKVDQNISFTCTVLGFSSVNKMAKAETGPHHGLFCVGDGVGSLLAAAASLRLLLASSTLKIVLNLEVEYAN